MGLKDLWVDFNIVASFNAAGFEHRRRHRFNEADLDVDLSGERAVVTGANSGIGFATAEALARRGADVVMVCRSRERGVAAQQKLRAHAKGGVDLRLADMGELHDVAELCTDLDGTVDILVHNAGALVDDRRRTSAGTEITFASHVVGPHLMTHLLRRHLRRSRRGRVVQVASGGMYLAKHNLNALLDDDDSKPFDGVAAYAQAKRAQVMLNPLWGALLRNDDVVHACMHPGWSDTPGVQTALPTFQERMQGKLRTPEQGADTVVWLACSPPSLDDTGRFWFDRAPARTHVVPFTKEKAGDAQRLWDRLEEMTSAFR